MQSIMKLVSILQWLTIQQLYMMNRNETWFIEKKIWEMGIVIYPACFCEKQSTQACLSDACLWSLPSCCSQDTAEWLWNAKKVAALIADRGGVLLFKEAGQYSRETSLPPLQYFLPARGTSDKL